MKTESDIQEILRLKCIEYGSQKLWSEAHDIDAAIISHTMSGRMRPTKKLLAALSYEKKVSYTPIVSLHHLDDVK